jgi:hypothetical protein
MILIPSHCNALKTIGIKASLFFFLFFFVSSAVGQKAQQAPPVQKRLYGQWKFHASSGGFSGKGPGWPANAKICVEFKRNGSYRFFENGKTKQKDKFKLVERKTVFGAELLPVIDFANNLDQTYEIKGDTLYLRDAVADGYSYQFLRK